MPPKQDLGPKDEHMYILHVSSENAKLNKQTIGSSSQKLNLNACSDQWKPRHSGDITTPYDMSLQNKIGVIVRNMHNPQVLSAQITQAATVFGSLKSPVT